MRLTTRSKPRPVRSGYVRTYVRPSCHLRRIEAGTSEARADTMQAEAATYKMWRRRGSIDQLKTDCQNQDREAYLQEKHSCNMCHI